MDHLTVELGQRSYPIWISPGVEAVYGKLAAAFGGAGNATMVSDRRLAELYPLERMAASVITVPSGEHSKCYEELERIHETLAQMRIGRDGKLIACGGGVVGDLAGFAAASYLRGIDFYQVPTTLLAMVDSSVGGKTGINLKAGKNLVGAFWQPKAVFICTEFLQTLPPQEFSAGMAEVIKYGMLYDSALFDQLSALPAPLTWAHPDLPGVIRRCCEIKAAIVQADEMETAREGGRALLNLGHTFAHAIEQVAGYGTYLHGEAVAIGLALAARLSNEISGTDFTASNTAQVKRLLKSYALPTDLATPLHRSGEALSPPPLSVDGLMDAMLRDKKARDGKLRFVVMKQLGKALTVEGIESALLRTLWADAGAG